MVNVDLWLTRIDIPTLNARLDIMEEFLQNEKMFFEVSELLASFNDLDSLIFHANLAQKPTVLSPKHTFLLVKSLVLLKQTLELVPALQSVLGQAKSDILKAICQNLKPSGFSAIQAEITRGKCTGFFTFSVERGREIIEICKSPETTNSFCRSSWDQWAS
jgi:hypothetical protein